MPRLCEVGGAYNTTTMGGLARRAVLKPARRGYYEESHSACCNYVHQLVGSRHACLRNTACSSRRDRISRSPGDRDWRSQRRRRNPDAAEGGRNSGPVAHANIHRSANRRSCGHTATCSHGRANPVSYGRANRISHGDACAHTKANGRTNAESQANPASRSNSLPH